MPRCDWRRHGVGPRLTHVCLRVGFLNPDALAHSDRVAKFALCPLSLSFWFFVFRYVFVPLKIILHVNKCLKFGVSLCCHKCRHCSVSWSLSLSLNYLLLSVSLCFPHTLSLYLYIYIYISLSLSVPPVLYCWLSSTFEHYHAGIYSSSSKVLQTLASLGCVTLKNRRWYDLMLTMTAATTTPEQDRVSASSYGQRVLSPKFAPVAALFLHLGSISRTHAPEP